MTTLDAFRPGARPDDKAKQAWAPPTLAQMAHRKLLCFDPSLSATGFVALRSASNGLWVEEARTFSGKASEGLSGWERAMAEAEDLEDQLDRLVLPHYLPHAWQVVIEQPPMGHGTIRNPESAILACKVARSFARKHGYALRPMISARAHRKSVAGNSRLTKKEHHQVMAPLLDDLNMHNRNLITNEAKRDALSVGLADLVRSSS